MRGTGGLRRFASLYTTSGIVSTAVLPRTECYGGQEGSRKSVRYMWVAWSTGELEEPKSRPSGAKAPDLPGRSNQRQILLVRGSIHRNRRLCFLSPYSVCPTTTTTAIHTGASERKVPGQHRSSCKRNCSGPQLSVNPDSLQSEV